MWDPRTFWRLWADMVVKSKAFESLPYYFGTVELANSRDFVSNIEFEVPYQSFLLRWPFNSRVIYIFFLMWNFTSYLGIWNMNSWRYAFYLFLQLSERNRRWLFTLHISPFVMLVYEKLKGVRHVPVWNSVDLLASLSSLKTWWSLDGIVEKCDPKYRAGIKVDETL